MTETNQSSNQLATVHSNMERLIDSNLNALPSNFNKTRFILNCMTVLRETKDIEKCEPLTVARTMIKGAFLGLDFVNRECYAIVYNENTGTKDNPKWVKSVQFQTDYKGEIKLAHKHSVRPVQDIYAKLVREGDHFKEIIKDGKQSIEFEPLPFNDGKVLGAFAVVYYKDGGMAYDVMSVAEIEATRKNYSKQANGPSWTKSPGEMQKKTVLRRLCKTIQLDFDTIEQAQAFEDGSGFDFSKEPQPIQPVQKSPFNVVEGEYTTVEEPPTDPPADGEQVDLLKDFEP